MEKKTRNIVLTICIIIMFVVFFIYSSYLDNKSKKSFIDTNYNGVITKIEYVEGRRDLPNVTIDTIIHYFGWEEKVKNYIKLGDSIVKKSGSETITVYRKNADSVWVEKVFK